MTDNSGKIILDLCGGTGAWSRPYKEAGYDVRVCTLPHVDVCNIGFGTDFYGHYDPGVMCLRGYPDDPGAPFLKRGMAKYIEMSDVYGILAAPPCTEFSLAKGSRTCDFSAGMEVVRACLRVIWECRLFGKLKFWAMENPVGFLRQFLGIPAYQFEHWEFGDAQVKRTDLWGYFKPPIKTHRTKPTGLTRKYPNDRANGGGWSKPPCPPEYAHLGLDRGAIRAITTPGFAQAFFRANR